MDGFVAEGKIHCVESANVVLSVSGRVMPNAHRSHNPGAVLATTALGETSRNSRIGNHVVGPFKGAVQDARSSSATAAVRPALHQNAGGIVECRVRFCSATTERK